MPSKRSTPLVSAAVAIALGAAIASLGCGLIVGVPGDVRLGDLDATEDGARDGEYGLDGGGDAVGAADSTPALDAAPNDLGGEVVAPWTPMSASPDAFYYDSDHVSAPAGVITTVEDRSGSGRTLGGVFNVVNLAATYVQSDVAFNGAPSIVHSNEHYLFSANANAFTGRGQLTIAVVARFAPTMTASAAKVVLADFNPKSTPGGWTLGTLGDGTNRLGFYLNARGAQSNALINDAVTHLIVVTYDGVAIRMLLDGTAQGLTGAATGAVPYDTSNGIGVGAFIDSTGSYENPSGAFRGAEELRWSMIVGWGRNLSPDDLTKLHAYSQAKYGTP